MRESLVIANWKMHGSVSLIRALLSDIIAQLKLLPGYGRNKCIILPPSIYLPLVQSLLDRSAIACGAQNIYPCDAGAYTGELSAPMLGDYNCTYVLVGHSERRRLFGESEKFIAEKFHYIKEHAMIPILCVGETLVERNNGLTEQVLAQQLRTVVQNQHNFEHCVVAYEPVWAIGTGLTASPEQAQSVHAFIRSVLASFDANAAQNIPIVYGGSVNGQNAAALFAMPDVDGGLVGASSLHAQQFVDIIKCIN